MYIPKNRITTNLSTQGGEYIKITDKSDYVGFYWKDYKGKFYTGKNPSDKPTIELVVAPEEDKFQESDDNIPISHNALLFSEVWEERGNILAADNTEEIVKAQLQYNIDGDVNNSYVNVKRIDINQLNKIPYHRYPKPTEEDYNIGLMMRYFSCKVNQNLFFEVDKDTYDNIGDKNGEWDFKNYFVFKIPWTLIGKKEEVEDANRNVTLLTNQRLFRVFGRGGITQFLKQNYLKFYVGEVQENLVTNGGEFTLPNGLEYKGPYHIHPTKGPMVGSKHTKTPHDLLTPIITETPSPELKVKTKSTGSLMLKKETKITYSPRPMISSRGSGGGGGGY